MKIIIIIKKNFKKLVGGGGGRGAHSPCCCPYCVRTPPRSIVLPTLIRTAPCLFVPPCARLYTCFSFGARICCPVLAFIAPHLPSLQMYYLSTKI